ncbi:MAG: hypothetical protein ABSG09_08605 [Acidimicrobiales bacterium]
MKRALLSAAVSLFVVLAAFSGPSSAASKSTGMNGPGLLAVTCANDNAVLQLLNPTTAAVLDQVSAPQLTQAAPGRLFVQAGCPIATSARVTVDAVGGLYAREQFSPNFAEVTWSTFPLTGTDHVGYMNVDGGNVVDVTALTSSSGFGSTPPDDQSPVFNPANGEFYFLSATKATASDGVAYTNYTVHMFDPVTHAQKSIGRIGLGTPDPTLTIQDGVAVVGDLLISPNGRVAADSDVFYAVKRPTCCGAEISTFQDCTGDSYCSLNVYGWIGDRAVVVNGDATYEDFYRATVFASGTHPPVLAGLLPRNSDQLSDAVLSPNGSQMVFEGAQDGTTDLYETPTSAVGHPKTLSSDFGATIIAWQ